MRPVVAPQPLPQPSGMFLFPDTVDKLVQPFSDFQLPPYHDIRRYVLFCFLQPHSVHDQPAQFSMKLRPVTPGIVVMPGSVQIPQQVWQGLLICKVGNRVLGTPEIGHAVEK